MAVVGTVHLLAFGFDSQGSLPPSVPGSPSPPARARRHPVARRAPRLARRAWNPRLAHDGSGSRRQLGFAEVDPVAGPRRLRFRDRSASTARTPQLRRGRIGSRGGRGPRLPDRTRHRCAAHSRGDALGDHPLDEVIDAGGFPIVFGCLEPETMLVVGEPLAAAAEALASRETVMPPRTAPRRSMLWRARRHVVDRRRGSTPSPRRRVHRRPADVDDTISALADAGLVSSAVLPFREDGSNAE